MEARGYRPLLVAGDGAAGVAKAAPYERILSTCASPGVPGGWIDQLTLGGVIVAPFTFGGALAVLTKTGPETVCGHFDAEQAWFMPLRPTHRPMPDRYLVDVPEEPHTGTIHHDTTDVEPAAFSDPDFCLWLSLHIPSVRLAHMFSEHGSTHAGVIVYTAHHRATITFGTAGEPSRVSQDSRRLGDTVTAAWHSWRRNGCPNRTRLGIAAHISGVQYAWLDSPDGPYQWPLPTA